MKLRFLITILLCACISVQVRAEEITVAVASNFTLAMKEIVAEFEKGSDHKIKLVFGSSGRFYAQIKNGAPFYVFFSADQVKPMLLEKEGLAVSGSRFTYATGALVLWSSNSDLVEDATVLQQGKFNKLSMANPKLAPYGMAAIDVLQNLGLETTTKNKWVQGENIAQAYQFVVTGNADLGFVALSQIMSEGRINNGSAWRIPNYLYTPILQDAVLLRKGENSKAAQDLMNFVGSDSVRKKIEAYGYQL